MSLETKKKYIGNNEFRLETKFVDGKKLIEGKIISRLKSYIGNMLIGNGYLKIGKKHQKQCKLET